MKTPLRKTVVEPRLKRTKTAAAVATLVPPPAVPAMPAGPLRVDIGCGKNKKAGFVGVDSLALPGVDVVADLRGTWPFADNSVDEANCSHFIEHLTNLENRWERTRFFNELYRVLKPGASCALVFPHWASNRYYGDPTHKEPFSEMGFYYLSRKWRLDQAPHSDAGVTGNPNLYACDFDATWGFNLHPALHTRNAEYQQHALAFWKEAAQDIISNLKKIA